MLLVDAYNVLHVTGELPPDVAGVDVTGLADLIARSRWRSVACRLVCDGTGESGADRAGARTLPRGVSVIYAGPGRDADTLIEQLIDASTAPRRLVVVSSDRRLRAAARRRRCRSLTSEQFLRTLAHDMNGARTRRSGPALANDSLEAGDVERWLREFGIDPGAGPRRSPEPPRAKPSPRGKPPRRDPTDASLHEQIQREWPGRVDPDDLDMEKWLNPPTTPDPPEGDA